VRTGKETADLSTPLPQISCGTRWRWRTSCAFLYRKPHTWPLQVARGRKSGYAPVEMTNLLSHGRACIHWIIGNFRAISCHLDRSAAQWRDLQCAPPSPQGLIEAQTSPLSSRPKRSEVEGSAVRPSRPQNLTEAQPSPLSSRPERTRISCHAALDTATPAAFVRESRMNLANATKLNRKSVVAEWRNLRFPFRFSHRAEGRRWDFFSCTSLA
jgi:hypothetical protein